LRAVALPDVQTRRLDLGDFSVLVREAGRGAGTPVLCLHGGPGMSGAYFFPAPESPWGPGLRALAERHHVIAYDQRGCGGSGVPEEEDQPLALSRHVDDVERVRSALGLGPVALLGHSFGTVLALLHTLARPETLSHLVLSGGAPTRGFVEGYRRAVEAELPEADRRRLAAIQAAPLDDALMRERFALALPLYLHHPPDPAARDSLLERVEFSARVNRALAAGIEDYDLRPALGHVTTPALVVYGAADRVVAPEHQLELRLPAGRFVAFHESGHFPFLEEPGPFAHVVHYFLRHGAPRGATSQGDG
jgi:proline iminopeptidase